MPVYTNAYKGRANRKESATHLSDEFDRIAAAFTTLQDLNVAYIDIFNHEGGTNTILIDPANGQMQEITLTQDTLISIADPVFGSDSKTHRLTVIVHGLNFKIINGWGPQTWKEEGNADWLWIFTGPGPKAGALLEFAYDGLAWVCLAFSKNQSATFIFPDPIDIALFPLISDLVSVEGTSTLVWSRSTYGYAFDSDGTEVMLPAGQARFTGARYLKNWIATPDDLQSVGWTESGVTVTTESSAGQDGGDVDKITFNITNGELQQWMLMHFGRSSEISDTIKFAVSFDAKMAGVVTSGTCRAVISIMGVESGGAIKWHRQTFNITDDWQSFGAILDPVSGKDNKGFDITTPAGARTLVKFAIESPPDGTGDPILIEHVNIVILKDGELEMVELPEISTIGASLVLTATGGSTGAWIDGSKTMTLAAGEYVDFQDSLEIGRSYLVAMSRTTGNTVDVQLEDGRTYWTGNSLDPSDTTFVKDATFTIQYEGGVFKLLQTIGSSVYNINIYLISDEIGIYGTENGNSISSGVITYLPGSAIASSVAVGVGYEPIGATNLLDKDKYRSFDLWTKSASMSVFRGAMGIDSRPSHASIVEDSKTGSVRYISETVTIPNDSKKYGFGFFVPKYLDSLGNLQITEEWDGTVTLPSQYIDFQLMLTGGTTEVAGEKIRLEVKSGLLNATANGYSSIFNTNFDSFRFLELIVQNNGTGNTIAEVRIYPAPASSLSNPGTQSQSVTGWTIVDFAQIEDVDVRGRVSSPVIPGDARTGDSVATTLDDGILYTEVPVEIGDVTTLVWTFDNVDIYKSITWIRT